MLNTQFDDFRIDFAKEIPISLVGRLSHTAPMVSAAQSTAEQGDISPRTLRYRWIWIAATGIFFAVIAAILYYTYIPAFTQEMPVERISIIGAQPVPTPIQPVIPEPQPPQETPAASINAAASEHAAFTADTLELSYTYLSHAGERIEISTYAKRDGEQYAFYRPNDTPITSAIYASVGSPSQPDLLIYESADQSAAGIIAGMVASNGQIYYGVLSLYPLEWVVPCKYEDIYIKNGRYFGDIPQGNSQDLSYPPVISSTASAVEDVSAAEEVDAD